MITIWGEGRGFRVIWLLEEMGLPYKLRGVDLLKGAENDPEFLGLNPAGYIPALTDGDTTMVESIAIMEYLLARHGHASQAQTPLALPPADPNFGLYQQFLHLGEAGLAMPTYMQVITKHIAPEADRDNWTAREAVEIFRSRLGLVTAQLAKTPHIAGPDFTAADISITWALNFAHYSGSFALGEPEQAYRARMTSRPAYQRALETCQATKGFYERNLPDGPG